MKWGKVQDQQQRIAETQITKIEATLSDGHKFKRGGNEEQFKHNNKPAFTTEPRENSFVFCAKYDSGLDFLDFWEILKPLKWTNITSFFLIKTNG
jgi:hypothetical protein